MRKTKTIKIDDREILVRELTVAQITEMMESLNDAEINNIDTLFPDRLPSAALFMSTGMTVNEIAEYTPSEIEIMLDAVEEVNPTFAGLMQRLANVGRQVLAAKESDGQSAD